MKLTLLTPATFFNTLINKTIIVPLNNYFNSRNGLYIKNANPLSDVPQQIVDDNSLVSSFYINDTNINNRGYGYINTNSIFGEESFLSNSSGIENAAFGYRNLVFNRSGKWNSSYGSTAMYANTTGIGNTGIGTASLYNNNGNNNTGLGAFALKNNTTGYQNVGVGNAAGFSNTTGSYNTTLGSSAFEQNIGSDNVGIGTNVNGTSTTASGNTIVGTYAQSSNKNNCIVLGKNAVATNHNEISIGSTTEPVGTVTTESLSSSKTWTVTINGVSRKILLA